MDLDQYIGSLRKLYEDNANPEVAEGMQKYLRNLFTCYGIYNPRRKEIHREFFKKQGLPPDDHYDEITRKLWDLPQRDFQYFGMILLEKARKKASPERIELYEFTIINKSWWDTVDFIAAWLVGEQFRLYPALIPEYTRKWMSSGNIWLQRTCLIFQLKYKQLTNTELMAGFIEELAGSKEFFIRKAIGWAMREYSKTNPQWVKGFIENHDLSPLSRKEALKWIVAKGLQ
jgi:3-methyladenine DNA glycosylase AlkD